MDQAIWLLRSAYAAVGCALRSAHPNAEEVSSLCSAHAAVGCVLPSSHPNADDFRCSAVRTPLWVAYCVCCFRMRKNFVSLHHFVALRCARRCGLRIAALHPNAGECRCSASWCRTKKLPCSTHAAAGCVLLSSHTPPLHLRCKFLVPWEQMACLRPILQLRMQSDADRCYIAVIQLPRRVSPAAGCRASFCWRSPPCRWTQPCQVVEFNYQFMPDGT